MTTEFPLLPVKQIASLRDNKDTAPWPSPSAWGDESDDDSKTQNSISGDQWNIYVGKL